MTFDFVCIAPSLLTFIFVWLYFLYRKNKEKMNVVINKNIFTHDVRSSLATIDLVLESLSELVPTNAKEKPNGITLEDLPSLIDILNESKKNILVSINQFDANS